MKNFICKQPCDPPCFHGKAHEHKDDGLCKPMGFCPGCVSFEDKCKSYRPKINWSALEEDEKPKREAIEIQEKPKRKRRTKAEMALATEKPKKKIKGRKKNGKLRNKTNKKIS